MRNGDHFYSPQIIVREKQEQTDSKYEHPECVKFKPLPKCEDELGNKLDRVCTHLIDKFAVLLTCKVLGDLQIQLIEILPCEFNRDSEDEKRNRNLK